MPGFLYFPVSGKVLCQIHGLLHLVSQAEKNLIKHDANSPRYNSEGFCGHCVPAALKHKCLKSL